MCPSIQNTYQHDIQSAVQSDDRKSTKDNGITSEHTAQKQTSISRSLFL